MGRAKLIQYSRCKSRWSAPKSPHDKINRNLEENIENITTFVIIMGAAVSVTIRKLPEELDSTLLQKVCGEKFDQQVFDDLKDSDGFVSRADLLAYIDKAQLHETGVDEAADNLESSSSDAAGSTPQGEPGAVNEAEQLSDAQLQVGVIQSWSFTLGTSFELTPPSNMP